MQENSEHSALHVKYNFIQVPPCYHQNSFPERLSLCRFMCWQWTDVLFLVKTVTNNCPTGFIVWCSNFLIIMRAPSGSLECNVWCQNCQCQGVNALKIKSARTQLHSLEHCHNLTISRWCRVKWGVRVKLRSWHHPLKPDAMNTVQMIWLKKAVSYCGILT